MELAHKRHYIKCPLPLLLRLLRLTQPSILSGLLNYNHLQQLHGKAKADTIHDSVRAWLVKLCDSLTTRAILELFCDEVAYNEEALYQV